MGSLGRAARGGGVGPISKAAAAAERKEIEGRSGEEKTLGRTWQRPPPPSGSSWRPPRSAAPPPPPPPRSRMQTRIGRIPLHARPIPDGQSWKSSCQRRAREH